MPRYPKLQKENKQNISFNVRLKKIKKYFEDLPSKCHAEPKRKKKRRNVS